MRSAVPLPCFFEVTKSQKVAGQRPQQGTKSCRMRRNSVCPSVRPPSIHLRGLRTSWRGLGASQQGLRASQRGADGRTGGRTDGISPHSTGLRPLSGPLPCYVLRFHHIKEAGQGYRWPHDAFWRFIWDPTHLRNSFNSAKCRFKILSFWGSGLVD